MTKNPIRKTKFAANGIRPNLSESGIDRRSVILGTVFGASWFAELAIARTGGRMHTMSAQNLTVTAEISSQGQHLAGSYSAQNTGSSTIFLFNVLPPGRASSGPDLDFYVEYSGGSIIISKKIISPRAGTRVEYRVIPFVTKLVAGQIFKEAISASLPLPLHTPYSREQPGSQNIVAPVYFEIGYFIAKPGTEAMLQQFNTNQGPRQGFDPFPVTSQKIIRVGPFAPLAIGI